MLRISCKNSTFAAELNKKIYLRNMKPILFALALLGSCANFVAAQDTDPVLFTFGNDAVRKSEFVYVYEKHNATDTAQYTQTSVDNYLTLYTNFKLRVKEAENMRMDTMSAIQQQLEQYRKQLAQSFLQDKEITESLIKEGYERLNKEVRVQHLLVSVAEDASPADTAAAYKKTMELYSQIVRDKKDFTALAKEKSQDPSAVENGGDLGYITAFQTVYPFETAAYTTPVGTVSKPVRTKFGYHLVKVIDIRPAKGKVQVAHILIKSNEKDTPDKKAEAKKRIETVYNEALKPNADFAMLARQNSEDKETAMKGGELPMFSTGRMYTEFEDASFALQKAGDVSKPIQTKLGWHIIKLLTKQPIASYDVMKTEIKRKVERDSRSRVSPTLFINRMKKDFQFEENRSLKDEFIKQLNADITTGKWKAEKLKNGDKTLFSLNLPKQGRKTFTQQDFANFAEQNQTRAKSATPDAVGNKLYDLMVEEQLKAAEETQLEDKHPEFAKLMKEFRDGNLLYELMGQKVWNKAMQDSAGLKTYHEAHKQKYLWGERTEATIITCKAEEMKDVQKQTKKMNGNEIMKWTEKAINKMPTLKAETGIFDHEQNPIVSKVEWKEGFSAPQNNADGTITFVKIHKVMPPTPKKLEEARGYVIADYQNQLSDEWIAELRQKYPVKTNQDVLKTLYKK